MMRLSFNVSPAKVDQGLEIAMTIADRLRGPQSFAEHLLSLVGRGPRSSPTSLATGYAGAALLMAGVRQYQRDEQWGQSVHAHLSASAAQRRQLTNLFDGLAGVLAAARYSSKVAGRGYEGLTANLATYVAGDADATIGEEHRPIVAGCHVELMFGLAGLYIVLDPSCHLPTLVRIAEYFDWLASDSTGARWLAPSLPGGEDRVINLGASHGLAGILLALSGGPATDPALSAADRITSYLIAQTEGGSKPPHWPRSTTMRGRPNRVSWCYGVPGTAAALWQAGRMLDRADAREIALNALRGLARRDIEAWGTIDHGLCHGTVGNALIIAWVGAEAGCPELAALATRLIEDAIDSYNDSTPLGYQSRSLDGEAFDEPGFLTGAAGVALGLLTALAPIDPSWLRVLGLRCGVEVPRHPERSTDR